MWMSGTVGLVIGLVFNLVFPACVVYFFTRPNVKAAFATSETATV